MNAAAAGHSDDFNADLQGALAVWTRQPLLPLASILFWTIPAAAYGNDNAYWAVMGLTFVLLGWAGTEREWYRRAFAGETFLPSEIWRTTRRFFGPFLRLGLILSPLAISLIIIYVVWSESVAAVGIAFSLLMYLIFDVALTFVTPALTFSTSSAKSALSIGLATLRAQWPAAAPYALAPALVVILGTQTLVEPVVGRAGALVATALASLVALGLKGATVAFYLRHLPAPRR